MFDEAKNITLNYVNNSHRLQKHTIRINPNLIKGAPAATRFVAALDSLGLGPRTIDPQTILKQGLFGWHGTRTPEAVLGIAFENLDPNRRSGQYFGPGEYCAAN